jgi:hypothetical protein
MSGVRGLSDCPDSIGNNVIIGNYCVNYNYTGVGARVSSGKTKVKVWLKCY